MTRQPNAQEHGNTTQPATTTTATTTHTHIVHFMELSRVQTGHLNDVGSDRSAFFSTTLVVFFLPPMVALAAVASSSWPERRRPRPRLRRWPPRPQRSRRIQSASRTAGNGGGKSPDRPRIAIAKHVLQYCNIAIRGQQKILRPQRSKKAAVGAIAQYSST